MKGLILAGGHGTGLRPLTYTYAKQLIPIANKPVIEYVIDDLKKAGITDIGVIVGHTKERIDQIKSALGDGSNYGVKITYIEQDAPRGIGHAILIAKDFAGDVPTAVYLGDNLLKNGIAEFVKLFENSNDDAGVLLTRIKNPQRFGVAVMNKKGELIGFEEKPQKPKSDLAMVGVYLLRPSVFNILKKQKKSWRGEIEISEAVDDLIKAKKYKVSSYIVDGWWKDTGKPEDLLEANRLVLDGLKPFNKGKVEEGARITGRVSIGAGTLIKKGCVIRGPVIIGKRCNIANAYIGPFTSIGDDVTFNGGEIEASIIFGNTKIECGKRIVDSLIGSGSVITSSHTTLPQGYKMIVGEKSQIVL